MRKSSILIILLIGFLFIQTPTQSDKTPGFFTSWRPDTTQIGCHSGNTINVQVGGALLFNSSWLVVEKGQEFALSTTIINFAGNLTDSGSDLTIGFNILDENNTDFMGATMEQNAHSLDENGTSITPWEATFTAPDAVGDYTLVAYAVGGAVIGFGGDSDYFYWIRGQVRVEVKEPTGPQGVDFELDHDGVVQDKVNLTVAIANVTDVKDVNIMYDNNGTFIPITLENSTLDDTKIFIFDVSSFSPGIHNVTIQITNQANINTTEIIDFEIAEPVTIVTTTSTTTSEPFTQSTETETKDHGLLSSPISLGILVVVMLISISAPLILMKKFFA